MKKSSNSPKDIESTKAQNEQFVSDLDLLDIEISNSHPLVQKFIAEQRKEIAKLQTQIAKSKVQYESEKAKIEADCAAKISVANAPKITLNLAGQNKPA